MVWPTPEGFVIELEERWRDARDDWYCRSPRRCTATASARLDGPPSGACRCSEPAPRLNLAVRDAARNTTGAFDPMVVADAGFAAGGRPLTGCNIPTRGHSRIRWRP